MKLEEFRDLCNRAKGKTFSNGYSGFISECPACHDTKSLHLACWESSDGWWHVKCQHGCLEGDILSAVNLTVQDRAPDDSTRPAKPQGAVYLYTDENNQPLFIKERYYRWDVKKNEWEKCFVQKLPDNTNGIGSLGERAKGPYQLHRLRDGIDIGATIYIVEGEKAVHAFEGKSLYATCQPAGAGRGKWLKQHTDALKGATSVRIVADRDTVGESYAREVAAAVSDVCQDVLIVQSKTNNEHDDAWDHFEAGYSVSDFVPRKDLSPKRGIEVRIVTGDFKPVVPEFLIEPYLIKGKTSLLDGKGSVGKSSLCIAWAAALSRGVHPFKPLEEIPEGPVKTLYLHTEEDTDDELETVYRANWGAEGMILYAGGADGLRLDPGGIKRITEQVLDDKIGLIVTDSIFYFLEGVVRDPSNYLEVLPTLAKLNEMTSRTGVVMLNLRHQGKYVQGRPIGEAGLGSVQFVNSHRGQLILRLHPDKENHLGVVVVEDGRGSILRKRGGHFCYRRDGNRVDYLMGLPNPFEESA